MSEGREDTILRGELLVSLRQSLRKCIQLAEMLATEPLTFAEARSLLGRLEAIRGELDDLQVLRPDLRHADNDPFWRNTRQQLP